MATALDFGGMGTADAAFFLEPEGTGTKVAAKSGCALDGLIGKDYEEGLARLKTKVEDGSV
ncbi:MAG: hypothetical protein ACFCUR_08575 [Rhodomicrobiaceae bacterium]